MLKTGFALAQHSSSSSPSVRSQLLEYIPSTLDGNTRKWVRWYSQEELASGNEWNASNENLEGIKRNWWKKWATSKRVEYCRQRINDHIYGEPLLLLLVTRQWTTCFIHWSSSWTPNELDPSVRMFNILTDISVASSWVSLNSPLPAKKIRKWNRRAFHVDNCRCRWARRILGVCYHKYQQFITTFIIIIIV